MEQEQYIAHAIIDGEKFETEELASRENPTYPNQVVGHYPF
ncbi:alanine dehydrogenase [Alkalibacillus flavidus]|uniref:Alanine dehydrogenase n=1 Tax=Alkalibacillus flavidus TaxID=546021 RepID=A0ABV2KZ18_9BACI